MSLVKFTELPAGSIQGGDVLAVAGASSYKVSAVEYANWSNKRIQGATDKTIAEVYQYVVNNVDTINNRIMPQLGQIGTNKTDIAAAGTLIAMNVASVAKNTTGLATTNTYVQTTRGMINAELLRQYENAPAAIALMIKNDNYIKNPAAQHISRYLKDQAGLDMPNNVTADLRAKNLEYPGWSRDGGDLITYNFTAAIAGTLTIGQLGGHHGGDMEYRVNGGAWVKVGNVNGDNVKNIGIGYTGNAGAQVSVRVNRNFSGIAFAIPTPAYWLSKTGHRGGGIDNGLLKLSHGLLRARIDLEACGYWFGFSGNTAQDANILAKPMSIGLIKESTSWEYDHNGIPVHVAPRWNGTSKNAILRSGSAKDFGFLFASTDPNLYNQAEVYV